MVANKHVLSFLLLAAFTAIAHGQCVGSGPVQYVTVVNAGPILVVTWHPPADSASCNLEYNVEMTYDGKVVHSTTESVTYVTIIQQVLPCVEGHITITPTDQQGNRGVEYATPVETDIGKVQNLALNESGENLTATWDDPPNTERCNFVYNIIYSYDEESNKEQSVTDRSYQLDVITEPCINIKIGVTPINLEQRGTEAILNHETPSPPIQNFDVSLADDETVVTRWDPPSNAERCILSYKVQKRTLVDTCFKNEVSVTPINRGTFLGNSKSEIIETLIGAVLNLKVQVKARKLAVTYDRPENTAHCEGLTYVGQVGDLTLPHINSTNFEVDVDAEPCYIYDVQVRPVSPTSLIGRGSNVSYEVGVGPVINLTAEEIDNIITVNWNAPERSKLCSLRYLIEYTRGSITEIQIVDLPTYYFRPIDCGQIKISVTPHTSTGLAGPTVTILYNRVCKNIFNLFDDINNEIEYEEA